MLDQFARQNRWWLDPSAIQADRHIVRMREARVSRTPDLPFQLDRDAVYTLRGPRQVGKSTLIKRQIKELLETGWPARRILYLDVELAGLEKGPDLVAALRSFLEGERANAEAANERCAIFLDEVTRVQNWAGALRGLVDNGELSNVSLIATGSHTRDLRAGGERLPGRRGGLDLDWELLPVSFREYAALADPKLKLLPSLLAVSADAVRKTRRARELRRPQLAALFERYLATGGFLPAVNDDANHGMVRAETFQTYREAILGEFTRADLRETYLREVVGWVAGHLGQKFDYRGIAADTDIGSKDTARGYIDNLEASYVATVCYRTPDLSQPSPAFRGPKKVHALDPLLWRILRAWAAADPDPWPATIASLENAESVGHLVESVVAVHARRAFGERVYHWRPDNRREIDLVVAPPNAPVALLETKYRRSLDDKDIRILANFGGGLMITRDREEDLADGPVHSLPAAEFLASIEAPSLAPCR